MSDLANILAIHIFSALVIAVVGLRDLNKDPQEDFRKLGAHGDRLAGSWHTEWLATGKIEGLDEHLCVGDGNYSIVSTIRGGTSANLFLLELMTKPSPIGLPQRLVLKIFYMPLYLNTDLFEHRSSIFLVMDWQIRRPCRVGTAGGHTNSGRKANSGKGKGSRGPNSD